ncbi:MAG: GNAT family N-acetyltransferase [Ensifer adhaerens]
MAGAEAKGAPALRFVEEKSVSKTANAVFKGLKAFNLEKAGSAKYKRFAISLRDDGDEIVGGIVAYTAWNWCFIELLWVDEALRGSGSGRELVARVEAVAASRGARYIYVDTFSFQGDGFYQKLGYDVYGKLDDFPPGFHRIWLKKELS